MTNGTTPGLIARLLGHAETSTPSADIRRALDQINTRRKEIEQRISAITNNTMQTGAIGPERKRALATGSPSDVIALDRELKELETERDAQLTFQETELRKRLEIAQADEARQRLPGSLKSMRATLAKYTKAAEAMQSARDELDQAVSDIIQARNLAGPDSPGLDDSSIERIADIRGLHESADPSRYSIYRKNLFRDLGGSIPEKARPDYVRTRRDVEADQEFFEETADGQTTRRQTGYLEPGGALRQR